jgi:hypothetical protein
MILFTNILLFVALYTAFKMPAGRILSPAAALSRQKGLYPPQLVEC